MHVLFFQLVEFSFPFIWVVAAPKTKKEYDIKCFSFFVLMLLDRITFALSLGKLFNEKKVIQENVTFV